MSESLEIADFYMYLKHKAKNRYLASGASDKLSDRDCYWIATVLRQFIENKKHKEKFDIFQQKFDNFFQE